jgi:hypothetical protein
MKANKLFLDQYNNTYHAKTIKELKEKYCLRGSVSKMYFDTKEGITYHSGYVIGQLWLSMYQPIFKAA